MDWAILRAPVTPWCLPCGGMSLPPRRLNLDKVPGYLLHPFTLSLCFFALPALAMLSFTAACASSYGSVILSGSRPEELTEVWQTFFSGFCKFGAEVICQTFHALRQGPANL